MHRDRHDIVMGNVESRIALARIDPEVRLAIAFFKDIGVRVIDVPIQGTYKSKQFILLELLDVGNALHRLATSLGMPVRARTPNHSRSTWTTANGTTITVVVPTSDTKQMTMVYYRPTIT